MGNLEPASFEVESFERAGNACVEVRGRWFGVRGRRFMRPALTTVSNGREHRMLALLDHKPWLAEEGDTWLAAFPCASEFSTLDRAEMTVAPDVTVALPTRSPSKSARGARRSAARRSSSSSPATTADADASARATAAAPDAPEGDLPGQPTALQSSDATLAELATLRRECEQLRAEQRAAAAAHEAMVAERQRVIESEVERRIADLRAEAERERAGARLAAETARERDQARAARDHANRERNEAARERDEFREQRDVAQSERNRMLADRDAARSRIRETERQWELTAALGTQRTLERDAVAVERDRLLRDRDAALAARERIAHERDAALEANRRMTRERDVALEERDRMAKQSIPATAPRAAPDQPTAVLPGQKITPPGGRAPRPANRRPPRGASRRPAGSTPTTIAVGAGRASPIDRPLSDETDMWRNRLLALSALLVALVVLVVLLLAK